MIAAIRVGVAPRIAVLASGFLLACFGCANAPDHPPALTAEDARRSLIGWIESGNDSGLKLSLDALRTAPVEPAGGDSVKIANWQVNLAGHTFGVVFAANDFLHSINGSFEFDAMSKTWNVSKVREART